MIYSIFYLFSLPNFFRILLYRMNTEFLFLFLILLLGLALCSFLGGDSYQEGFGGNFIGLFNVDDEASDIIEQKRLASSGAANGSVTQYDNYNHYNGNSTQVLSGSTYYGPNGLTAIVQTLNDGTQVLRVLLPNLREPIVMTKIQKLDTATYVESFTNAPEQPTASFQNDAYGSVATVVNKNNGEQCLQIHTPTGDYVYCNSVQPQTQTQTQQPQSTVSSSQYFGATGTSIQPSPEAYQLSPSAPGQSTSTHTSTPGQTGIPRSQIPPGQEDLYILKTEIVPPVCPVCPVAATIPRQESCPPCPACARCPEAPFECKKVPNYNAMNGGNSLPVPTLADFSQFGM